MGVFHIFYIVQMVANQATHHILLGLSVGWKWFEKGGIFCCFKNTPTNKHGNKLAKENKRYCK